MGASRPPYSRRTVVQQSNNQILGGTTTHIVDGVDGTRVVSAWGQQTRPQRARCWRASGYCGRCRSGRSLCVAQQFCTISVQAVPCSHIVEKKRMVVRGSRARHGQFGEKIHVCGKSWRRGRGKIFRPSFDLRHMIFQPPSPLVDQKQGAVDNHWPGACHGYGRWLSSASGFAPPVGRLRRICSRRSAQSANQVWAINRILVL